MKRFIPNPSPTLSSHLANPPNLLIPTTHFCQDLRAIQRQIRDTQRQLAPLTVGLVTTVKKERSIRLRALVRRRHWASCFIQKMMRGCLVCMMDLITLTPPFPLHPCPLHPPPFTHPSIHRFVHSSFLIRIMDLTILMLTHPSIQSPPFTHTSLIHYISPIVPLLYMLSLVFPIRYAWRPWMLIDSIGSSVWTRNKVSNHTTTTRLHR